MFRLRKLHPPFGSRESPLTEASYAEGEIRVVDGFCEVQLPETRDRLLKLGYSEEAPVETREPEPQEHPATKPASRRGRR